MTTELIEKPEEIEETTEDDGLHYNHPTDPELFWCGKRKHPRFFGWHPGPPIPVSEIDCVVCVDMCLSLGGNWWWEQNGKVNPR
jgi:hypothetical protein